MTEPPSDKKPADQEKCSEPPTDTISQFMETYEKLDKGELTVEEASSKVTEIMKNQRQKKLDCLKKLGL